MANVSQTHIDFLKGLDGITVGKNSDGFFSIYSGGNEQTIVKSSVTEDNTLSRVFGEDFFSELSSGGFDSLMNDGILSGAFGEDGFNINLDLGSAPAVGGGSLETDGTEIVSGSPSASTTTGTVDNTGSIGATDVTGGSTGTTTGNTSTGTPTGGGSVSTGTGSTFDQGLQTQSQLFGQQAYNAQQQKNAMLEALGSANPGNQIDLTTLISSITGNQGQYNSDSGLAANEARQKLLKRQGRGTASTKVKDKIQPQALLGTPTLLDGS